jgi:hypothetical protein
MSLHATKRRRSNQTEDQYVDEFLIHVGLIPLWLPTPFEYIPSWRKPCVLCKSYMIPQLSRSISKDTYAIVTSTMYKRYRHIFCDMGERGKRVNMYNDADLLTTRLAVHALRTVRYDTKIRASVSCHLPPFSCSTFSEASDTFGPLLEIWICPPKNEGGSTHASIRQEKQNNKKCVRLPASIHQQRFRDSFAKSGGSC